MTKLTVDKDSLDVALNTPCPKCGETRWVVAPPSDQKAIRPGAVRIRCKACKAASNKAWQDANHEKARAISKASSKAWYEANPEKKKALDKAWRDANPGKAKAAVKAWCEANPQKLTAFSAKRRTKKLQRTPLWADLDAIKAIYENCPPGYHVDHIIPLQGKLVSGLHVPENLQYLTPEENISKGNKFRVE